MNTGITIDISKQQLLLSQQGTLLSRYPISTAANGVGEQWGSYCTPRGLHEVRAKIGANAPPYSVFHRRRETGEIYSSEYAQAFPERDWILTRILWLRGLEKGKNRWGNCDTMRRYIYIHGTHEEMAIGTPVSHGCIRMRNQDILKLFEAVHLGTLVSIHE